MSEDSIEIANPAISVPDHRGQLPGRTKTALVRTLGSVLLVGRELLDRGRGTPRTPPENTTALVDLCRQLLEQPAEASGLALAAVIAGGYRRMHESQRAQFFALLASEFEVDGEAVLQAADNYRVEGSLESLMALRHAAEAPRQTLFRRINMVPGGTRTLVDMRGHLLEALHFRPELKAVEFDLRNLFVSWFNRGFLELRRIDWSSPARVLEQVIRYEAVHEINGWEDLRSRLCENRRCYAFFHPALADEPLVFAELALTATVPTSLETLLAPNRTTAPGAAPNTVVFYSISHCHPGLAGIPFGYSLLRAVVDALRKENASLTTFITLSSVPGFRQWLRDASLDGLVPEELVDRVREPVNRVVDATVYHTLLKLCAHYLIHVKAGRYPHDAAARFHLGNGAQLCGIHGGADLSVRGLRQSAGIMVNYLYDLSCLEENHNAYIEDGRIAVSREVRHLLD